MAYTWVASATAAAGLLGGPLAAALLSLDGVLGLRGWRWLFLLEGIPPFLLAAALWAWLPASPLSAGFLTPEQRTWLHQWVHGEQGLELAPLPAGPPAAAGLQQHARECEEGSSSGSLQRHEGAGEDAADEWGLLLGAGERSTAPAADKSHPATPGAAQQEEHTLLPACAPMPSRRHSPSSSPGGGGAAGSLATDASPAAAAGLKPGLTPPPEAEAGDSGLSRAALRQGLLDRRVWKLGGFMFCIDFGMNACHFWIPSIIRDLLGVQVGSGWACQRLVAGCCAALSGDFCIAQAACWVIAPAVQLLLQGDTPHAAAANPLSYFHAGPWRQCGDSGGR